MVTMLLFLVDFLGDAEFEPSKNMPAKKRLIPDHHQHHRILQTTRTPVPRLPMEIMLFFSHDSSSTYHTHPHTRAHGASGRESDMESEELDKRGALAYRGRIG